MTLRTSLIKLAYANPELRPRILPLLKEAGSLDNLTDVLVGTIKMELMTGDFDNRLEDAVKSWARSQKIEVKGLSAFCGALVNAIKFADLDEAIDKAKVEAAKEKYTSAKEKTASESTIRTAASAKAMMRLRKLEDHLKSKGDTEGLELMEAFLDAMGLN